MKIASSVSGVLGFLAALLATQAAFGAERIEVISLDLGACWARSTTEGQWDLRSKNDSRCFGFGSPLEIKGYNDQIVARMKELEIEHFAATRYEAFLHCGGAGATLLLGFADSPMPLCLAVTPQRDGIGAEKIEIYYNPDPLRGSQCSGVDPESLLIKPGAKSTGLFDTLLRDEKFKSVFESVSSLAVAGDYYQLKLRHGYRFKVQEARKLIESDPLTRALIDGIDYNRMQFVIGEAMSLGAYDFAGY